ncbi:prephenate dehydratase [Brunnivagina elsteri]|uniref:Prephenate dehydratase n=1 Tax=Brunnivagina elsteri CCALA 953 TaxID=987040 RepID=A0A2A2TPD0_9CYAN|nr:prephenate dehydratase [Calothrix elsteri]PAX60214.1 prephenate dehydratase [Calothrix elsteri CCALA 953]
MNLSIAHLGPSGNHSEQAALFYVNWLTKTTREQAILCPYPSIAQSIRAVAEGKVQLAVVPAENSIEGSVTMTMDAMWQLDNLQIRLALVMPIVHVLISCATDLGNIKIVYSHPQALAQCQGWLERFLPNVQLMATNSTTEALERLETDLSAAAISSERAAQLYNLPTLASGINDRPENFTRFWVVSQNKISQNKVSQNKNLEEQSLISQSDASHTSLAFSVAANVPGALAKTLQVFAHLGINLSRIESRPTKRSLGEYLFFIDIEANFKEPLLQSALTELLTYTEVLKIFGSYNVLSTDVI